MIKISRSGFNVKIECFECKKSMIVGITSLPEENFCKHIKTCKEEINIFYKEGGQDECENCNTAECISGDFCPIKG